MIIPPINAKGKFVLAAPFDNILSSIAEYTVTAIRSLEELYTDRPLENIYLPVGLTDKDMQDDKSNNVPIVVLVSTSNDYLYVPANRILSMPVLTGVKYQERSLLVPLGILPVTMNVDVMKSNIEEYIYTALGNKTKIKEVLTSAVVLINNVDDKILEKKRKHYTDYNKSYITRYYEAVALLKTKDNLINKLEEFVKSKLKK